MTVNSEETSDVPAPAVTRTPATGRNRAPIFLSVLVGFIALLVGAGTFKTLADMKEKPAARTAETRKLNVEVYTVKSETVDDTITGFGTATAHQTSTISAQVSGQVVWVSPKLEVGQPVKAVAIQPVETLDPSRQFAGDAAQSNVADSTVRVAEMVTGNLGAFGQGPLSAAAQVGMGLTSTVQPATPLVRIDSRVFRRKVEQLEAQLEESETELTRLYQEKSNNSQLLAKANVDLVTVRQQVEVVRKLIGGDAATEAELTNKLLELRRYEDSLLQRELESELYPLRIELQRRKRRTQEAAMHLASLDLSQTLVTPPFDGKLSQVTVERGQFVTVGQPLFELTDTSSVEIKVPIRLSARTKLDQLLMAGERPEAVLSDRNGTKTWRGRVVRVAPAADSHTRTVDVFIEVRNTGLAEPLVPGSFVEAHIRAGLLRDQNIVPREAIIDGYVFVSQPDGKASRRRIEVVRTLENRAAVSGLEVGDQVVLTNLDVIYDGAELSVTEADDKGDE